MLKTNQRQFMSIFNRIRNLIKFPRFVPEIERLSGFFSHTHRHTQETHKHILCNSQIILGTF